MERSLPMICNKCKNRTICKYYAFLSDAPIEFTIDSCEKYVSNDINKTINESDNKNLLRFKQPIDYSEIGAQNDVPFYDEDEERIEVDLSEKTHNNVLSITDILMGNGDDNNGPTKEN
jgi:hypothetical protein